MNGNQDTAENFVREAEQQATLERPKDFNGEPLAPYSEGVRLLWLDIYEGATARWAGCGLIWLLIQLQREFESLAKQAGAAANVETLWMLASANFLRANPDREHSKAQCLAWVAKIGKAQSFKAMDLAYSFIDESAAADAKQTTDETPDGGATPGK